LITNPQRYLFLTGFRTFASGETFTTVSYYSPAQMWERHVHFDRPELDRPTHRKLGADYGPDWEPSLVGDRPNDLWLRWGDDLQHFDGAHWQPARLPPAEAKGGRLLLPGGEAGAVLVSKSGRLFRLKSDRHGVEEWGRPHSDEIVAGAAFEHGRPWVVSSGGLVERWSDTSWTPVALPKRGGYSRVEDVYALSADDVWLRSVADRRAETDDRARAEGAELPGFGFPSPIPVHSLAATRPRRLAFRCTEPGPTKGPVASYLPASAGCNALRLVLRDDVSGETKAQYAKALEPYGLKLHREWYGGTAYFSVTPPDYGRGETLRAAIPEGVVGHICLLNFALLGAPSDTVGQ
jgi:hypothetical protein